MATVKSFLGRFKRAWAEKGHYDKFIIGGSTLFLCAAAFFLLAHRIFFTADQFYFLGFFIALVTGQAVQFLWDWTPVVLLIFSYEYLRGLVPMINHHIHVALMPLFDKLIFGVIPSHVLQVAFYNPNHLHWYDYTAVILYLMHFIVPLIVGFFFWQTERGYFRQYVAGIVALSYLTFLTYLIFPAAPPWMGSQLGVIPPVAHITNDIVAHLFNYIAIPSVYQFFGINLAAAVPSLHAAYPLLTALFVGKKYPKTIPILVVYVLAVWLAVMYLGEHYFFDVYLGAIYALVVYAAIQRVKKYLDKKKNLKPKVALA